MQAQFSFTPDQSVIAKNGDGSLVWGWASVITEKGAPVVDSQGDIIEEADLQKAAHNFVKDARVGKVHHDGVQVAEVVESIVFTDELQKALGIELKKTGWFIGMEIQHAETRAAVKAGRLRSFSIGGTARPREAA